jgi:hypothetical protein
MDVELKQFAVKNVDTSDDDPNGSFEVILSAPTEDRDNETIDAKAFNPLPDHITFDTDHGMSTATTVGSGTPYYEGDLLKVKGTYSSIPRAQEVRTLVKEGHIRTVSVAFMNAKSQVKDGKKHLVKAELLNGSFVPIPSNRDSLVVAGKSVRAKAGARNSVADSDRLQQIHDLAVDNGATCDGVKHAHGVDVKSIVGSVEALQDRVRDALEDAYGNDWGYWGHLRGVVPNDADDGGTCVFDSSRVADGYDYATYQQTFTDDGAVVTLVGEAVEVDIHEIVVPDADADREDNPGLRSAKPGRKDPTGAADDEAELELRARAVQLLASTVTG